MHSEKGPKVNFNFVRLAHESQSGGNHHVKDATLMVLSLIATALHPPHDLLSNLSGRG